MFLPLVESEWTKERGKKREEVVRKGGGKERDRDRDRGSERVGGVEGSGKTEDG